MLEYVGGVRMMPWQLMTLSKFKGSPTAAEPSACAGWVRQGEADCRERCIDSLCICGRAGQLHHHRVEEEAVGVRRAQQSRRDAVDPAPGGQRRLDLPVSLGLPRTVESQSDTCQSWSRVMRTRATTDRGLVEGRGDRDAFIAVGEAVGPDVNLWEVGTLNLDAGHSQSCLPVDKPATAAPAGRSPGWRCGTRTPARRIATQIACLNLSFGTP
jgi:hypothetical protein